MFVQLTELAQNDMPSDPNLWQVHMGVTITKSLTTLESGIVNDHY